MKSIETQGKTVDQAIELGLYKLGVTRDQVKIKIIEEAGLFNKAKVRLSVNQTSETEAEVKALAEELLSKMGLNLHVYAEETEAGITLDLTGEDAALAIGKHGDCLESIAHILNNIYNKDKGHDAGLRIIVDSNHYRERREANLTLLAKRMAAKAAREGRNIKLEPMTSYERRVIHNALNDNSKVITESEGVEPNRYVVIKPNGDRRKEKAQARKEAQIEAKQGEEVSNITEPLTARADND